jgi:hypothetical protein
MVWKSTMQWLEINHLMGDFRSVLDGRIPPLPLFLAGSRGMFRMPMSLKVRYPATFGQRGTGAGKARETVEQFL